MLESWLWPSPILQQIDIRAKVHYLQVKENGRFIRWNVQADQLQLLNVEVEDERHARVQRPMVATIVQQKQSR